MTTETEISQFAFVSKVHRVVLTSTAYICMYGRVYGLYWYELNSNQIHSKEGRKETHSTEGKQRTKNPLDRGEKKGS